MPWTGDSEAWRSSAGLCGRPPTGGPVRSLPTGTNTRSPPASRPFGTRSVTGRTMQPEIRARDPGRGLGAPAQPPRRAHLRLGLAGPHCRRPVSPSAAPLRRADSEATTSPHRPSSRSSVSGPSPLCPPTLPVPGPHPRRPPQPRPGATCVAHRQPPACARDPARAAAATRWQNAGAALASRGPFTVTATEDQARSG